MKNPVPSCLGLVAGAVLAILASPTGAFGQEGFGPPSAFDTMSPSVPAVCGYVTDMRNRPIAGARVEISSNGFFPTDYAFTDGRGYYAIMVSGVGDSCEVTASAEGFYPRSQQTSIRRRERVDFTLMPDPRPREIREMKSRRRVKADKVMRAGLELARAGKREEAIASLRKATEIDPNSAAAHNNLGVSLRAAGDDAGAEKEFRRALELRRLDYFANLNLGVLLYASGRFHEATPTLEYAVLADPTSAPAEAMLGRSYLAIGLAKRALQHLQEAQTMAGNDMDLSLEISEAYVEMGDLESALHVRKRWLSRHASDPMAPRVEATVAAIRERLGERTPPGER